MIEIPWEQLNKVTIVISLFEGAMLLIKLTVWLSKNKLSVFSVTWRLFIKVIILIITSLPALIFLFFFALSDLSHFWKLSLQIILIFVGPGAIPTLLVENYRKSLWLSLLFSMLAGIFVSIFFWSYAVYANNFIKIFLSISYIGGFLVFGILHSAIARMLRIVFADHTY